MSSPGYDPAAAYWTSVTKAGKPQFDPEAVDDTAIDQLSRIVTGTQNLSNTPTLVQSLTDGSATPEEAQAVDQYLGALKAQQVVRTARSTGARVQLTSQERQYLDMTGTPYDDVNYTRFDQNNDLVKQAKTLGYNVTTDAAGNIVKADPPKEKKRSWLQQNLHNLNPLNVIKEGGSQVLHGLNEAWNFTNNTVTSNSPSHIPGIHAPNTMGGLTDFKNPDSLSELTGGVQNTGGLTDFQKIDQDAGDARAAGYDPNNPWSMLAFRASSKAYNNTSDLSAAYGADKVELAKQYLADPEGTIRAATQAGGEGAEGGLVAAQQLAALNDPGFSQVVRQVASRHSGIGNLTATSLGIDPVEHATTYGVTSAATDLAASFLMDPTLLAITGLKAVKAAQIGLNSVDDATGVERALTGTKRFQLRVQQNHQDFLDQAKIIREAGPASREGSTAQAYIMARYPDLAPLLPDVHGTQRLAADGSIVHGGKPFETLGDWTDYLTSKAGLARIMTGNAVVQGSYMPGAVSRAGLRAMRGNMAARANARSFDKFAAKVAPREGDAFDPRTGQPILGMGQTRGEALYDQRKGSLGYRTAMAVARFTKFLPEDSHFVLDSVKGPEQVRRYMGMWGTRYDANAAAAAYALGDDGVRNAILQGMEMQTMYAAGLGKTEAGLSMINKVKSERAAERYALVDDTLPGVTGEPSPAAVHPNQRQKEFDLPDFRELRRGMARSTVWSATAGRVLESQVIDGIMGVIKQGWLLSPRNIIRNVGEGLTNVAVRGEMWNLLAAKAIAANNGGLPERKALTETLASLPGTSHFGYLLKQLYITMADPVALRYIAENAAKHEDMVQNFSAAHARSYFDQGANAGAIIRNGGHPTPFTAGTPNGKIPVETDTAMGASRMADNFRFMAGNGSNTDPEYLRKVMAVVRARANGQGEADALADLVVHMNNNMEDVFQGFRRNNFYRDADGNWQQAVTPNEKALAREDHARTIVADWEQHLLVPREERVFAERVGGGYEQAAYSNPLIEYMAREGKAPSADWIHKNLPKNEWPAVTQITDYVDTIGTADKARAMTRLSDWTGDKYTDWVQRPIDRMLTLPLFHAQYGNARKAFAGTEARWVAEGMKPEAAANAAHKWAEEVAMARTFQRTDNPILKTHMDVVGRNFFAFSRATQDFIRRWSTTFVQDPRRLRKMQLAIDASVSGGLAWTDPNTGQMQFQIPMTGALQNALVEAGQKLHIPFVPQVPVKAGNLTGQVMLVQPGLQNPAQMSLTPIVNIPMRAMFDMLPDHASLLNEMDRAVNGDQGYGQPWYTEIMPTLLKQAWDSVDDGRNGMLTSATKESLAALMASGEMPDGMDANETQQWLDNVKVQTRNFLFLRGVLGAFSPAPVSSPYPDEDGVDPAFQTIGIKGLNDEFKKILNDTGGDKGKAIAIWAQLHPDKLVYTVAGSESTTKGVGLPATQATEAWMENNVDWLRDNKSVAAYFIPQDTSTGFDMLAWRTQLQLGLRQNKTISDFYQDAAVATAETQYWATYDQYKQDVKTAQSQGNTDGAKKLDDSFSAWKQQFYALNPLFAQKQGSYADQVNVAKGQIESLRHIASDADMPDEVKPAITGLQKMLAAYDSHTAFQKANAGQDKKSVADRKYESATYADYMAGVAKQNEMLTGVYNGVFRYMDNELTAIK